MKLLSGVLLVFVIPVASVNAQINFPKVDTTVKFGKVGYRVECKNKTYGENLLDVWPVGFSSEARAGVHFMIRGRVARAEIVDLNADGYPDLVLYIYTDSASIFGTIYAFIS